MFLVARLDYSAEDQRRAREVIRLFDQAETQDTLGLEQMRDTYGLLWIAPSMPQVPRRTTC